MTDPGIFSIFDPAPSSMTLLREKPLGINYREPTLRELLQPLPPPDKAIFKHGAQFNRFVHSAEREKKRSPPPTSRSPSTATKREGSQEQQQQQQKEDDSKKEASPDETISAAGGTVSFAEGAGGGELLHDDAHFQQQKPTSASLEASKSFGLLSRGLKSNQPHSGRRGMNQRDRGNSSSSTANPLVNLRQHAVPSARLPNKGRLAGEASLIMAEVCSATTESRRETDSFIVHGREVISHKHDGTALQPGTVSPLRAYEDLVKRMSPGRKRKADDAADGSKSNNTSSARRRPSPLRRLFSAGRGQRQQGEMPTIRQQEQDDDERGADDEDLFDEENGGGADMATAEKLMAILRDPNLAPGIVYARAQLPPWKDQPKPDAGAAALALTGGLKNRKKKTKSTPRWAAQTATNQQRFRRQSIVGDNNKMLLSGDDKKRAEDDAADEEEREELMRKHANFSKQLRVEDKEELERTRKALAEQRKRHMDEMILARLAPAEREERIVNKAMLDPFRLVSDRQLPFPETAARDRYTQAQRDKEIPELVMEGLEQIEKWRPHPKSKTVSVSGGHEFAPSNASILVVQRMGLASVSSPLGGGGGGAPGSESPRLRAVSSQLPKEGTPRMRNPASPKEQAVKHTQAHTKQQQHESAFASKMQNLHMTLEAKHQRAEAKKNMYA